MTSTQMRLVGLVTLCCVLIAWMVALAPRTIWEAIASTDWQGLPMLSDWDIIREGCLMIGRGDNPYVYGTWFYSPPWTCLLLTPYLIMPRWLGFVAIGLSSFIAFIPISRYFDLAPMEYAALVLSSWHVHSVFNGNIEWLPWLGVFLPPPLALVVLSTKPHSTLGIMLFLLWRAYRKGGIAELIVTSAPLTLLILWWIALIGMPIGRSAFNWLWPMSIPGGLVFLWASLRTNEVKPAAAVGPLISPYATYSYVGLLLAARGKWLYGLCAVSWVLHLLHNQGILVFVAGMR